MATLEYLRCPACTSMRPPNVFGIIDGRFEELTVYENGYGLQTIGGRGRCEWEFGPLSVDQALALRENLQAAIKRLEEMILEANPRALVEE